VKRTVKFIHHPTDFPSAWLAKVERSLLDLYVPAARRHGLDFEFLPSHRVLPCVDGRPQLLVDGIDVLEERGCYLLEQTSADPQADRFLRAIYEVVAASDSVLLNRTTEAAEYVERDKMAMANRAAALGIPCIPTLVVPFGKYARNALEHVPLLEASAWILKPREMSMGRAVLRLEADDLLRAALDMVAQSGISYVIQPYLPNDGDMRVYVVNGEIAAAQWRRPKSGGYLANTSQGGSSDSSEVPRELELMCKRICDSLKARYLCIDWLVTPDGYVLNEWCTTLGGFKSLPPEERVRMADRFFAFISSEIEHAESPASARRAQ
jgi:hypothetical protein